MKKLLLLCLFSGSLNGFSQTTTSIVHVDSARSKNKIDTVQILNNLIGIFRNDTLIGYVHKPDTLRATLIVYYDSGPSILHTKPGFVVRNYRGDEVFLDDKKRVIKAPLEVYGYKIKK